MSRIFSPRMALGFSAILQPGSLNSEWSKYSCSSRQRGRTPHFRKQQKTLRCEQIHRSTEGTLEFCEPWQSRHVFPLDSPTPCLPKHRFLGPVTRRNPGPWVPMLSVPRESAHSMGSDTRAPLRPKPKPRRNLHRVVPQRRAVSAQVHHGHLGAGDFVPPVFGFRFVVPES